MIIVDTREKKIAHILEYFDQHGIEYAVRKLDCGDYMTDQNPHLSIDRKQNLDELAGNLCSKDNRFWREIRRAHDANIRLVVLVEHSNRIKHIDDVKNWKSKYSRVTGRQLANAIYRINIAYGVDVLFCDKKHTAERILEVLNG